MLLMVDYRIGDRDSCQNRFRIASFPKPFVRQPGQSTSSARLHGRLTYRPLTAERPPCSPVLTHFHATKGRLQDSGHERFNGIRPGKCSRQVGRGWGLVGG